MNYSSQDVEEALKSLQEKYPDLKVNNNKSIGSSIPQTLTRQEYRQLSMKRSNFKNIIYGKCHFENIAFTDSSFSEVYFKESKLIGNSFACCDFYKCGFEEQKENPFEGNNFSQSNFTSCAFHNVAFISSGFLQTLFHNCKFTDTRFQGSTLEGSRFTSCTFSNMDAGNVNVEFIELLNSKIESLTLPFYQLPYIIGVAEYMIKGPDAITLRLDQRTISLEEYKGQIHNLILYYEDKSEYFPVCNLHIMQNQVDEARESLLNGINAALTDLDFRMIRHLCRLAQRHELLDEVTTRRVSNKIEDALMSNTIPPERLNDCIIHAGEIRQILLREKNNSVMFNLTVRTNICKKNKEGVNYVNSLCNELNAALSQNNYGQNGFQVAVANHSPYEIIIDVICSAGALATVAQLVWGIVEHHKSESKNTNISKDYTPVDKELYIKYVDARIEQCKEQLLNLKSEYSGRKLNKYIEEVTQKLKTDITELYDSDIMIFKNKNS